MKENCSLKCFDKVLKYFKYGSERLAPVISCNNNKEQICF